MEQAASKAQKHQEQDTPALAEKTADSFFRKPMQEVSTLRLDMYASVHKGLRNYMTEVLAAVGRMDAEDAAEVAGTAVRVRDLLDICRRHLHHENQFIHPAMESRKPGSTGRTADDHVGHEKAIEAIEADLLGVEAVSGKSRMAAAQRLYRNMALFVAENFEHMHFEETENNATLWATHSDAELAAIHDALVSSIPQEKLSVYLRWMIPAMTPADRAGMLSEMRQNMPGEAFVGVLAIAKPHLAKRDWTKLLLALGEVPTSSRQAPEHSATEFSQAC